MAEVTTQAGETDVANAGGQPDSGEAPLSLRRFLYVVGRYFPLLKPYWPELVLLFVLLPIAGALIQLIPAFCSKLIIDVAFPRRSVELLILFAGTALLMMVLERLLLVFIRNTVGAHLRTRVIDTLGRRFYKKMLHFDLKYHHGTPVGEKIYRCDTDVIDTSELLGTALPMTVQYGWQFLITVAALCLMDWRPVVITTLCAPIFLLVAQKLYNVYRRVDFTQRREGQKLTAHLEQSLANISVVYAHGARRREAVKYRRRVAKYGIINMIYWFMREVSLVFVWPSNMPSIIATYVMGLAAYWVITRELSLGQWQAMNQLIIQAIGPLGILINYYQVMRLRMVPAERILALLDRPSEPSATAATRPLPSPLHGDISFHDVSFAYDPRKPVLEGLSFTIPAGTRAAFVGPSGIGKTTVMSLILGLYTPDSGAVRVDGHDLRELPLHEYRRHVGIVLQSPVLFDRTVRENILYGVHDGEGDLVTAARAAELDEFVLALPQGYDTVLSEGGGLSLGQQQRISLARCMAGNPRIVLLDEPTALLDPKSARQVVHAIDRTTRGRTTIYISHDLLTVHDSDIIFVLQDGRIAEQGAHETLMALGGLYAGMWRRQQARTKFASPDGESVA